MTIGTIGCHNFSFILLLCYVDITYTWSFQPYMEFQHWGVTTRCIVLLRYKFLQVFSIECRQTNLDISHRYSTFIWACLNHLSSAYSGWTWNQYSEVLVPKTCVLYCFVTSTCSNHYVFDAKNQQHRTLLSRRWNPTTRWTTHLERGLGWLSDLLKRLNDLRLRVKRATL